MTAALKFEERFLPVDNGSTHRRWVSGRYQIVARSHTDEITGSSGPRYYAYVAIAPLRANGIPGCVDNVSIGKPTLTFDDAVAACEQHQQQAAR